LIHPTAIIEPGVEIGEGTSVWDSVHIRGPAQIGSNCIIGEKSYIAYGVVIGDMVKINAQVYVCTGVTIEDGVMLSAGTTFTNDRFPRATDPDVKELRSSAPDEHTVETAVRRGVTVGARAVIGPGVELGEFSMVGMGSVVTHSVAPFHLVVGNPARPVAAVCRCGPPLVRFPAEDGEVACAECGRRYKILGTEVTEL